MNREILEKITESKERLVPHLFTEKQIGIIEKYLGKNNLTNSEKTYLYSAIKKKIEAIQKMSETYYIYGDIKKEKIESAKKLLNELNKEAFVSGSFLFSDKHNDIDIYIISNKRKQYFMGKKHFIFITEEDLKKPIFISAAKYSVSNFFINFKEPEIKRPSYNDLIVTYEIAINEILNSEDQKTIREIIFEYYLHIKNRILDSFTLHKKAQKIISLRKKRKIRIINAMVRRLLIHLYSNSYLYNEVTKFLKLLKKDISDLKVYDNIIIYSDLLKEVKDECRGIKT